MKIALGTVQFGMDYGITNNQGKVSLGEVKRILKLAESENIKVLDTAVAYGDSEKVIGLAKREQSDFRIVTKAPSSSGCNKPLKELVPNSLNKLKIDALYGVMFHDENDLFNEKSLVKFEQLENLKKEKKVSKIGASFYTVEMLEKALSTYQLDIIQVPASCLDQRFEASGLLEKAKSLGIEIHARSLFLQGLLLNKTATLPINISNYKSDLDKFYKFSEAMNISPLALCLLYLVQNKFIDYGVVGCVSFTQLKEIINAYASIDSIKESIDLNGLASSSKILINPSMWEK